MYPTFNASIAQSKERLAPFLLVYLVVLFFALLYTLAALYSAYDTVKRERIFTLEKLHFWEEVVERHPGYPDAWYQAAVEAVRVGNRERAKVYLERALLIDAQFQKARELLALLSR